MRRYIACLDLELDEDIDKNIIFFDILKKGISIKENEISLNAKDFGEARAYLDTLRAVINYKKFEHLSKEFLNDKDLINILYMPPYSNVRELETGKYQGTKYCHIYQKIIINKEMHSKIKEIIASINKYQCENVDLNYYYWILKWFTFCLDEISINPNNMYVIARDETLFLKFWTLLEIISIKHIKDYNEWFKDPETKHNHIYESDVRNFINLLTGENICEIYKLRNKMIHEGKIHHPIIRETLIKLINTCYKSIKQMLLLCEEQELYTKEKIIQFRKLKLEDNRNQKNQC